MWESQHPHSSTLHTIHPHPNWDNHQVTHQRARCTAHKSPLKAHLTDADWVVVVVTGLSTLTPTCLFVLVRGEYRRPFGCHLKYVELDRTNR